MFFLILGEINKLGLRFVKNLLIFGFYLNKMIELSESNLSINYLNFCLFSSYLITI